MAVDLKSKHESESSAGLVKTQISGPNAEFRGQEVLSVP